MILTVSSFLEKTQSLPDDMVVCVSCLNKIGTEEQHKKDPTYFYDYSFFDDDVEIVAIYEGTVKPLTLGGFRELGAKVVPNSTISIDVEDGYSFDDAKKFLIIDKHIYFYFEEGV